MRDNGELTPTRHSDYYTEDLVQFGITALKTHEELLAAKQQVMADFLEMGRLLWEIDHNRYYIAMGCDSFREYLGTPEVSISERLGYALKEVYGFFVIQLQSPKQRLLEAGHNKLRLIKPAIERAPELAPMWLDKAVQLSRSDLKRELGEEAKVVFAICPWQSRFCQKKGVSVRREDCETCTLQTKREFTAGPSAEADLDEAP